VPIEKSDSEFDQQMQGLGLACVAALIGGVLIGIVGTAFRISLRWIGARHIEVVEWAHTWPWLGWILPVSLSAIGVALARWLIRPQPLASGSGIQHVEAIMRGEAEPASIMVVPIKFVGGLLAIGSGLALGREGPTIQMGATIGAKLAVYFRCAKEAMRDLQAALGGAGLAIAFNAPVAGAMFVFEEVAHAFRLRLMLVTLIGTATAVAVARMIAGNAPDFYVVAPASGTLWDLAFYFLAGCVLGLLGVVYNKLTIFGLNTFARLKRWPVEIRAGVVGAFVGLVAWFFPALVGGGDSLTQDILNGGIPLASLLLILFVRWFLGPLSYSVGTPGGLFSPLLLLGAGIGALFAGICNTFLPADSTLSIVNFAIVGMAAFFTGVVRAPLTGIILITEMTATTTLMVPLMASVFGAMLASSLVRGEPIYDTLRRRMLDASKSGAQGTPE